MPTSSSAPPPESTGSKYEGDRGQSLAATFLGLDAHDLADQSFSQKLFGELHVLLKSSIVANAKLRVSSADASIIARHSSALRAIGFSQST